MSNGSPVANDSPKKGSYDSAADLYKIFGFGGKSTKFGTHYARYTLINISYSAKNCFQNGSRKSEMAAMK